MRRGHREFPSVTAGAIALVVIVVVSYLGFTKSVPFRQHFEIKAAFNSANDLKPKSPVRIAGVNVGKVTEVEHLPGARGAVVTMRITDRSIPIRRDARIKIRPRIFLEGNYFVDVKPGTPSAKPLKKGETIPIQQTASPVQFGQVLTALQSDSRRDLRIILDQYGKAINSRGGIGFNKSIAYWEDAFRGSAIVNQATLGLLEHDLSGYIKHAGVVAQAFDRDPDALKSLITDFATTANALAVESENLSAAINELPRTLRVGHRALGSLNAAFPSFRRLVAALRPAQRSARPALDAALPFFRQARQLVTRRELGGLVSDLRRTVPDLVELNEGGVKFQQEARLLSSCQNNVVVPWATDRIVDDKFPTTGPIFEEAPKGLPGLAGESRSFDANGQYVRSLAATANFSYATGDGRNFFTTTPLQGINPPKAAGRPQNRPDVPCETQLPPDMRSKPAPPPPAEAVNHSSPAAQKLYAKSRQALLDQIADLARQLGRPLRVTGLGPAAVLKPKDAKAADQRFQAGLRPVAGKVKAG